MSRGGLGRGDRNTAAGHLKAGWAAQPYRWAVVTTAVHPRPVDVLHRLEDDREMIGRMQTRCTQLNNKQGELRWNWRAGATWSLELQETVGGRHVLIESLFCVDPQPRLGVREACRHTSQNRK